MPSASRGSSAWNASSAIAHAAPDPVDLARVLHAAQVLDERAGRHELDALEGRDEAALLGPGDAVVLEPEARARRDQRRPAPRAARRAVSPISIRTSPPSTTPAPPSCSLRLLGVAAVGDEQRVVGA